MNEMNINDFIWADSSLLDLKTDNLNHSLTLTIKDFREDRFLIIFDQINELVINDPIYFMEVKEVKLGDRFQIDFWDDEDLVLSFQYEKARIINDINS